MNPPRTLPARSADIGIGIAFALLAAGEVIRMALSGVSAPGVVDALVVGLIVAVAAGLHREAPGLALTLVWVAGFLQLFFSVELLLAEAAVLVVAYGCGRWGSAPVLWASFCSIPLGTVAAFAYLRMHGYEYARIVFALWPNRLWGQIAGAGRTAEFVTALLLGALLLMLPWLLGVALRFRHRADVSEVARQEAVQDAAQAQQIADLKEQQANLARDVHDVVGHSLAVILAQAESAQFRDDQDALKRSMRDIAESARTSLQDVRAVLSRSADPTAHVVGSLDSLIDGVRASGQDVADRVVGMPRPLPPELDVVAYRVLQEMLTNAIKHGRRGAGISVTRSWEDGLRIEVANQLDESPRPAGHGVSGMRRRLDGVGGSLEVRQQTDSFTVVAWIPVRPG